MQPSSEDPDPGSELPQQLLEERSAEIANREGLAPEVWVVGLIAIVIILLVLFARVLA